MTLAIQPVVWDFTSKEINLTNFKVLSPKDARISDKIPAVILIDDVDASDGLLPFTNAIELLKDAQEQLQRLGVSLVNIQVKKTKDGINFSDLDSEKSYPVEYTIAV